MKKSLLISLCIIVVSGMVYIAFRTYTIHAQTSKTSEITGRQKWEYCAIVGSSTMREGDFVGGVATVHYYDHSGYREERIKVQGEAITDASSAPHAYHKARYSAIAVAVAKLGDLGWELVGELNYTFYSDNNRGGMYFKKLKQ